MKKISVKRENAIAFFRDFFAIILGILLTFWGQGIYDKYQMQKNTNDALTLVRDELNENLTRLKYAEQAIYDDIEAAKFLVRYQNNYENAPADSLDICTSTTFLIKYSYTTDDAMELLKNSSIFQEIDEPKLALQIIEAYASITLFNNLYTAFYNEKAELIKEATTPEIAQFINNDTINYIELMNTLSLMPEGNQLLQSIPKIFYDEEQLKPCINNIEASILAINNYLAQ